MEIDKILAALHPLERRVLPFLDKVNSLEGLVKETGLKEVEVMRALQWLQNKNIVVLKEELREQIEVGKNGVEYLKKGLPEARLLKVIKLNAVGLEDARKKSGLSKDEFNIALGVLQKRAAIFITKGDGLKIKLLDSGKRLLERGFLEEIFLKKAFPLDVKGLTEEERFSYNELKKRKEIIRAVTIKSKTANLTDIGREIIRTGLIGGDFIDRLTPELLRTGKWKGKKFRRYDVSINVPRIFGGRRHFVNQAADYIKGIWIELGFREMEGNIIQTAFWDMDALFVPQDHPVREVQDTFYLKEPKYGELPLISKKVKAVHENGSDTGSTGWQYCWDEKAAKENLLRTHTTVLSARTIAALKKEDLPAKFFSVGKVFRNETLDWKHLFEFYQVEGIVVDPNTNFRGLIAYLKEFFGKMGYKDVRIRPAHFPYTEPSAEIEVLHPKANQWIELGGCGIFRPEVVKPLIGEDIPVLAWGFGLERIITPYYNIADLRDIYRNDLKQLREMKSYINIRKPQ